MKSISFLPTTLAVLLLSSLGFAQSSLEGLSSGRYEIHSAKKKSSRGPASESAPHLVTDDDGLKVRTLTEAELTAERKKAEEEQKAQRAKAEAEKAALAKAEADKQAALAAAAKTAPAVEEKVKPQAQEPDLTEQAQSLLNAQTEKIFDFYREQVHPDDIRNNKVEIEASPTVVYNESSSNYSYRDYQSYFTALKVRANVWFTPLIGVSGQILFSLAADVPGNGSGSDNVATKYDYLDLALNFRKFFGISRKSNSIETSILLSENKFSPSGENTSRVKTKSTAVGVGVKARFPTSSSYAWVLGGNFFPRVQHDESETGTSATSGSISESTRIGLDLGGEFKFSRESQLIWNLGASTERNLFDGAAAQPDPGTGTTPSNVSVTNALYMFSLGYRWGH